jgi:hypothetical protein
LDKLQETYDVGGTDPFICISEVDANSDVPKHEKRGLGALQQPQDSFHGQVDNIDGPSQMTASLGVSATLQCVSIDLYKALEVLELDAACVNAPSSLAVLQAQLVPECIVLLEVGRTRLNLRLALLEGEELAEIRNNLIQKQLAVELASGVKIFVRPEQYSLVISALDGLELHPRHIVVSTEFESTVANVINAVRRASVKNRRIIGKMAPTVFSQASTRLASLESTPDWIDSMLPDALMCASPLTAKTNTVRLPPVPLSWGAQNGS